MRMLDSFADVYEEFQPVPGAEPMMVAVVRDRNARDVLHDEVRHTLRGGSGIQHLGDGRMIHQSQRLALGFEAHDDLAGVHAGLDQLESHPPCDRLLLFRQPHLPHAAFADLPQ
jgi:hypothetical protein